MGTWAERRKGRMWLMGAFFSNANFMMIINLMETNYTVTYETQGDALPGVTVLCM